MAAGKAPLSFAAQNFVGNTASGCVFYYRKDLRKMKKIRMITAVTLIAVILGSLLTCFAEEAPGKAYVTISDGKTVVAAMKEVDVADKDEDGKTTINDLLIAIHETDCKDGFASVNGDYGLSITKLWGIENGGGYGFYLNDQMAFSLTDEVKAGDSLYAYVYSDTTAYSDAYSFFDQKTVSDQGGKEITLTLKYVSGLDENYAPVFSALEGADITADGKDLGVRTDAEGKATVTLPDASALISAHKEGVVLVPPVLVSSVTAPVTTEADTEGTTAAPAATGDVTTGASGSGSGRSSSTVWIVIAVIVIALVCVGVIMRGKKKNGAN